MNWQPIDTAPSDTPILATDGDVIVVLRISVNEFNLPFLGMVGVGPSDCRWNFDFSDLTLWMPLPPLPDKKGDPSD